MIESTSTGRVAAALRERIAAMSVDERLPATRELTALHGVSPVTVSRALAALSSEGLVVTRPGSGTFVAQRPRPAPELGDLSWQALALGGRTVDGASIGHLLQRDESGALSMSGGYPHPSLLPVRAVAAALARAARRPENAEVPPSSGVAGLRAWFSRSLGDRVSPDDVLVTAGGQSGLSTAFRAIVPAGATVLMESPTYPGAIAVARGAGLQTFPVPTDRDGVRPDALMAAFRLTGARLFYCQPAFQNPTGGILAGERRRRVREVARAADAFVIEDDFGRWLGHEQAAPPPLLLDDVDGRIVYVASLTKVTSPNLRVGALIARGPVAERLRGLLIATEFFVPRHMQDAALEIVSAPGWTSHLARLGRALTRRRAALVAALGRDLPQVTVAPARGGLNLWARLPERVDDVQLAARSLSAGVRVSPGRPYFCAEPPAPHLRIGFAAVRDEAELSDGVRRLAQVLG